MGLSDRQQEVAERIQEEARGTILHLEPNVGGFLVIQKPPGDSTPILYQVTLEPQIDGDEALHWVFLGTVDQFETN